MTSWTQQQLDSIGAAVELDIAALRPDGTLRRFTTIWVVRVGDQLFVRSYRGSDGAWYRAVQRRPEGRVRAAGAEYTATFDHPDDVDDNAIDTAYRNKYAGFGASYVEPMVAPAARQTTLRLNGA